MNPEDTGVAQTSDRSMTAVFAVVILVGVLVVGGLASLFIINTTKKIAQKENQQLSQAEQAYENPFESPTPTPYKNPFTAFGPQQAEASTQQYQNPFGQ